jgi:hypothetical protein
MGRNEHGGRKMRTLSLAAILALAAVPVAAQQADKQGDAARQQMEKQSQDLQVKNNQQGQSPQGQQFSAMSKQTLRSALEQAGFSQINIVDAAYVVRAKTKVGENVVMYIDPPAVGKHSGASGETLHDGSFKTDSIRRALTSTHDN